MGVAGCLGGVVGVAGCLGGVVGVSEMGSQDTPALLTFSVDRYRYWREPERGTSFVARIAHFSATSLK